MIHLGVVHLRMVHLRMVHLRMVHLGVISVAVMLTMRLMMDITRRRNRTRRGVHFMPGILCLDRNGHRQCRGDRYPQGEFDCAHSSTLTSRNIPASMW